MLAVAEALHRPLAEIEALTEAEFVEWLGYFQLKEKRREAAAKRRS